MGLRNFGLHEADIYESDISEYDEESESASNKLKCIKKKF